jgi:hypothetical protein
VRLTITSVPPPLPPVALLLLRLLQLSSGCLAVDPTPPPPSFHEINHVRARFVRTCADAIFSSALQQ